MKFGIVVTTIYSGDFIHEFYQHLKAAGDVEKVNFYVIGDLSTPATCREHMEKYTGQGLPWRYISPESQNEFLKPFPELAAEIPWKTDNRRNVGFLMALKDHCDVIISIDDDNYPKKKWPFIKGHSVVGKETVLPLAVGDGGWFNLCSMMDVKSPSLGNIGTIYPRGFPYARRKITCSNTSMKIRKGLVAVNSGLWSGDPDVDAATRLVTHCVAKEKNVRDRLLAKGTLMPINTQNTGLIRDAVPAYYYVKMGHVVGGMKLDRFGDILSGFFLQKCVQAVGHCVKVGSPVVEHRRFPHNLYKDLWNELAGMVIIDDMLPLLEAPLPPASSYSDAAIKLSYSIEEWSGKQEGFLWDASLKDYFKNVAGNMRLWVNVCSQLQ